MKGQVPRGPMLGSCLGLLVIIAIGPVAAGRAQTPEACGPAQVWSTAYEHAWSSGACETTRGRWREARRWFVVAHALRPSARTWWALGKTATALGWYVDATRELSAALVDSRDPLDAEQHEEAAVLLRHADPFVDRYTVQLEPADANLYVDGKPARVEHDGSLLLATGTHQLEATAPRHRSETRRLKVTGQDGPVLSFRLQKQRFLPLTLGFGAGAAATAGASIALDIQAAKRDEAFEELCEASLCTAADREHRDSLLRWRNATLAVSVGLALAALIALRYETRAADVEPDRRAARSRPQRAAARRFSLTHLALHF